MTVPLWGVLVVWAAFVGGYLVGRTVTNRLWYDRIDWMRQRNFFLDEQPGYARALRELMQARKEDMDPW